MSDATIRDRALGLLAERPGLTTRELANEMQESIQGTGTALRRSLVAGRVQRVEVAGGGPGKGPTHRWYLTGTIVDEPMPEGELVPRMPKPCGNPRVVEVALEVALDAEEELRRWRSDVEDALGLDTEDHTPLDAALARVKRLVEDSRTLEAVRASLGVGPEALVVDAIEELQRQSDDRLAAFKQLCDTMAAEKVGAQSSSSQDPVLATATLVAERDAWRQAHEQLAREIGRR